MITEEGFRLECHYGSNDVEVHSRRHSLFVSSSRRGHSLHRRRLSLLTAAVYALDASTGAMLWSYQTGNFWVYSSPAVADDVVYVGSNDHLASSGGNLFALNASTGKMLWSYLTGGEVYSSPAVANGVVYIGGGDKNIYALNACSGEMLWSYQANSPMFGRLQLLPTAYYTWAQMMEPCMLLVLQLPLQRQHQLQHL